MGQGWGHSGGQCCQGWAMRKCQFIFFQKHFPGSAGATEKVAPEDPWSCQAWALTEPPPPPCGRWDPRAASC